MIFLYNKNNKGDFMKRMMFLGLVIGAMTAAGCGTTGQVSVDTSSVQDQEIEGVFSFKTGQFEVFIMVDAERIGDAGILPDVNEAILEQYIPSDGFTHSTNSFLIKTPDQKILVDTGFGKTILDKLKAIGVEPEQINSILLTHLHGDHFSGIQKDGVANFPNAKIYLSSIEYETQMHQGTEAAFAPYGSNVETFTPGELGSTLIEIFPGIYPVANYGHTPGHTVFLVENGIDKFIIAGDFLHVALVQFPIPGISAVYDFNREAAAASRRQILEYAAANKIPVAAMHIVYPGIGMVEPDGEGFSFTKF
jgi:glyoxylase-like metal-dependent hydrolase (beta-lactamase superfamily II)